MAGVPSDLLSYVYLFLQGNGFKKAAKALQKSCGEILTELSGPSLLDIFNFYVERHSGELQSEVNGTGATADKQNRRKRKRDESSSEEEKVEEQEEEERPRKKKKKKSRKSNVEFAEDVKLIPSPAVTHSNNNHGNQEVGGANEATASRSKKSKRSSAGKENNLHSSCVGDETTPTKTKPVISQRVLQAGDDDSDSSSSEDQAPKEEGVATEMGVVNGAAMNEPIVTKKKRRSSAGATPFRRVGDDVQVDPRLQDNSFEAKQNSRGSWGEKANRDLKFTKGKSFRHEKTKKKRGTYKGGAIDTSVCSIKFDDSD